MTSSARPLVRTSSLLSVLLLGGSACGSSAALPPADDASVGLDARAEQPAADAHLEAADSGGSDDAASSSEGGSSFEPEPDARVPEPDSGMPSAPTCPPLAASADEVVLFAEDYAAGVSGFGFSGALQVSQGRACGGTHALYYATQQYDGFGIATPPVAAAFLEARVYVSRESNWTISAQPSGQQNAHCYRLPNSTLCGQFDPACGQNQDASSCILHLLPGFQTVRLSVPATTPEVAVIMFEQQSEAPTPTDLYVDDLRLVRR